MDLSVSNLQIETVKEEGNIGEYSFSPLPTGYGYTLANALRRVLLTAIEGSAATQMRIKGVNHQFTTIEGVKEDVVELTMNIKRLRFQNHSDNPAVVTLSKKGKGKVTAKDFELPAGVEVMDPDTVIATLAGDNASLEMEIIVERGVGYSPMEERKTSKIGVIVLDALYSPIVKASYSIEPTRFGGKVDLDMAIMHVETDGSISPKNAIIKASKLINEYFAAIGSWQTEAEPSEDNTSTIAPTNSAVENISVEELPLQTRTINALKKGGIATLKALAAKSDEDLADIKNLGEKSLEEITKLLTKEGIR